MGITDKAAEAIGGGACFHRVRLQTLDSGDRTLSLLGSLSFSERKEQHIAQPKLDAVLGEQVLALYDEFRPRLFRYMGSMNLDSEQAEEVIQETFMRLIAQLHQEKDIDNVQGWIVRVAHNFAVDVLKENSRDVSRVPDLNVVIENRVDPAPGPEEEYAQKEQMRRMKVALAKCNPQQRQCFHLRAEGFRYKDIGLALGISEQRAALVVKQVSVRLAAICG